MPKAPSLQELQAALVGDGREEPSDSRVLALPNLDIVNLKEALRHLGNVILNCLLLAGTVLGIAAISVVGDRIYLKVNDTGSSRFEAFLKKQGYTEQALAYRQQQEACLDSHDTLALCQGAAWLYLHPEIAVWPNKVETAASPLNAALAEVPRR